MNNTTTRKTAKEIKEMTTDEFVDYQMGLGAVFEKACEDNVIASIRRAYDLGKRPAGGSRKDRA